MIKTIHFFGLILFACLAMFARADTIDDFIRSEMQRQHIPGLALGIFRNGSIISLRTYGLADLEQQLAVRRDTLFQSASLGKMFTAAAIMQLAETSRLALDDPIRRHFPDAPPDWQDITVRHLLTHTAGLGIARLDLHRDYREDQLLQALYAAPRAFPAGAQFSYRNEGYILLGILVARASGQPYSAYLRQHIFHPAGMNSARVVSDTDIPAPRANGYYSPALAKLRRIVDSKLHLQQAPRYAPIFEATGDGALWLSLSDFAAWDAVVARRALLTRASWQQILRPVRLNDGREQPYGLGWEIRTLGDHTVIGHNGAWQGFATEMRRYDADGMTFVILTNHIDADTDALIQGVAERHDPRYRQR